MGSNPTSSFLYFKLKVGYNKGKKVKMTIIVSAFPCLGKTTLTNQNRDIYFDAEIYESRATKGMSESH